VAPGITEILLLTLLVVFLFGARKIPGLARGLGEGIRNFKAGLKEPDRLEPGDDEDRKEDGGKV
jgi:sec-independent protein translocase protein TatA